MKHVIKTSATKERYILRKASKPEPAAPMAFYVVPEEAAPAPRAHVSLQKAQVVEDKDGVLTARGLKVAGAYAKDWVQGVRNIALEREYPDLDLLFYDIRADPETARAHAAD